jgi:hypothetical protein
VIIKGNLLTIPVAGSMVYVEPLYVQASGGQSFPVLRKLLVYSDGNAAYESTLDSALNEVFGVKGAAPPASPGTSGGTGTTTPPPTGTATSAALQRAIDDAQQDESNAQAALRRGDFAAYGRDETALKSDLARIATAAGGQSP